MRRDPSAPTKGSSGDDCRGAALFLAAIETIHAGYWKISSRCDQRLPLSRFSSSNAQGNRFNQHDRRSTMSESFPLPTKPEDVIPSLIERFKSGRGSVVTALFEPKA